MSDPCPFCGLRPRNEYAHACFCVHEVVEGTTLMKRVAIGICCGRMLGEQILADEDAAQAERLARYANSGPLTT